MKKMFFSKVALVATVVLFALTACEKENENAQITNGTATITGKVLVDFDLSNNSPNVSYDAVPADFKIYAKYNTKALILNPAIGVTYVDKIIPVTITLKDNAFIYTVTVDANAQDVTVTLYSDDSRHTQKNAGGTDEQKVFSIGSGVTTTVVNGVTKIVDVTYKAN